MTQFHRLRRAVAPVLRRLYSPARAAEAVLPDWLFKGRMQVEPLEPRQYVNSPISPGLDVAYFADTGVNTTASATPSGYAAVAPNVDATFAQNPVSATPGDQTPFKVEWTGFLNVAAGQEGVYTFQLPATDGAILTIDGQSVIYAPSISGDLNLDGTYDRFDIRQFNANNAFNDGQDGHGWADGDMNGDGKVDRFDVRLMNTTPYPSTVAAHNVNDAGPQPNAPGSPVGFALGAGQHTFKLDYFQFNQNGSPGATLQWQTPGSNAFQTVGAGVFSRPTTGLTVSAGADRVATVGDTVTLQGSYADDAGSGTHTLGWQVTQGGTVTTASGATYAFKPTSAGVYTAQFSVTNAAGTTRQASVTVAVNAAVPQLSIQGVGSVAEGSPVTLHAAASPVPTSPSYVWSVSESGKAVTSGTGQSFTFTPDHAGSYVANLTLLDGTATPRTASTTLTVTAVAPKVSIFSVQKSVVAGHFAVFGSNASASPASAGLSYAWSVTKEGDSATAPTFSLPTSTVTTQATFTFQPPAPGTNDPPMTSPAYYDVTLTVRDGEGLASSTTNRLMVLPPTAINNTISTTTTLVSSDWPAWEYDSLAPVQFATDAVVQPDGKLLVAGLIQSSFADWKGHPAFLARYNSDLTLDTTFGQADPDHVGLSLGWVRTDVDFTWPWASDGTLFPYEPFGPAFTLLQDGRIVVGGERQLTLGDEETGTLAMYRSDGTLDPSFGTGGYAYAAFEPWGSRFNAVAYQPSTTGTGAGTLLAVGAYDPLGVANDDPSSIDYRTVLTAVARFKMDGTLDPTFVSVNGAAGVSTDAPGELYFDFDVDRPISRGDLAETATAVLPLADGSFIVAGNASEGENGHYSDSSTWSGSEVALAKFTYTGVPYNGVNAPLFGNHAGKELTPALDASGNAAYFASVHTLLPWSDGKFVAGGISGAGAMVARFDASGSLDTTFGDAVPDTDQRTGMTSIVGLTRSADATVDADGRLLVTAGANFIEDSAGTGEPDLVAYRLTEEGDPDTHFGVNGEVLLPVDDGTHQQGSQWDSAKSYAIAAAPDGVIYVAGNVRTLSLDHTGVAVARYDPGTGSAANLVATSTPQGSVDLSWVDDAGEDSDGFKVQRSTDGMNFQTIATVAPHVTTFEDTQVSQRTTYYYRVLAFDGVNGDRAPSNVAQTTTAWADARWQLIDTVQVPVTSADFVYSHVALAGGQTYLLKASGEVQIKSSDEGPDTAFDADAEYGHLNPLALNNSDWAGHGLVDYGIGVNSTDLGRTKFPYWGAPSTGGDHSYSVTYTPTFSTPQHVSLNFHDDYYGDNTTLSTAAPLQVQIYRQIAPAPAGLTATVQRATRQVLLTWDDGGASDGTVEVQQSGGGGTWLPVAELSGDATQYLTAAIAFNTAYKYRVTRVDSGGYEGSSNEASVVLPNLPPLLVMPSTTSFGPAYTVDAPILATDPEGTSLTYSVVPISEAEHFEPKLENGVEKVVTTPGTTVAAYSLGKPIDSTRAYVTVTDGDGFSVSRYLTINIAHSAGEAPAVGQIAVGPSQTISGDSVSLSVLAQDAGGTAGGLTYHWDTMATTSPTDGDPRWPVFSQNDTGSDDTTATFSAAGTYNFHVTVTDAQGHAGGADTTVTVNQALSKVTIDPRDAVLYPNSDWQFDATMLDQFGDPMVGNYLPTWAIDPGNGVDADHRNSIFSATASGGANGDQSVAIVSLRGTPGVFYNLTASVGGHTDTVPVGITNVLGSGPKLQTPATAVARDPNLVTLDEGGHPIVGAGVRVALSALGKDDAGEGSLKYTWAVADAPSTAAANAVTFDRNASHSAANAVAVVPVAGTYTFTVTIEDAASRISHQSVTSTTLPLTFNDASTRVPTSVRINPVGELAPGDSVVLGAQVLDQYGTPVTVNAADLSWSKTPYAGEPAGTLAVAGGVATYTAPAGLSSEFLHVSYLPSGATAALVGDATVNTAANAAPSVKLTGPQAQPVDSAAPSGLQAPPQPSKIVVDADTAVTGIVFAPGGHESYTLVLHPKFPGAHDVTLVDGSGDVGSEPDGGAFLATIKPAELQPGDYALQLHAASGGATADDALDVEVQSAFSLGGLTLPQSDLSFNVPGTGQSLAVARVYDSTRASTLGDFGYGWFLETNDAAVNTTATGGEYDHGNAPAMRYGDTVNVTLPGGERHAFSFTPIPTNYHVGTGDSLGYQSASYVPMFVPVDGSSATLTVSQTGDADDLLQAPDTGEFFARATNAGYNVANAGFGNNYTLIEADGTKFVLRGSDGKLVSQTDLNGATITYGADSISSSAGYQLKFTRDASHGNRITSAVLADAGGTALGGSVNYAYVLPGASPPPDTGDLRVVTDRASNKTTYAYDATHLLTGVVDPHGTTVLTAAYVPDTNGELASLHDTTGKAAPVNTGPTGADGTTSQSVTDLAGGSTETVYDDHGNAKRVIKPLLDATGKVVSYSVNVTKYGYVGDNPDDAQNFANDPWDHGTSVLGLMTGVTQYQPFTVYGPDPTGRRYTQQPTDAMFVSSQTFKHSEDPSEADQRMLVESDAAGADGRVLTTTYAKYVKGKPQVTVDPYGSTTYSKYDPTTGNLLWTLNAAGEGTLYAYANTKAFAAGDDALHPSGDTFGAGQPAGVALRTYAVRDDDLSIKTTDGLPDGQQVKVLWQLTDSTYYTDTNLPAGHLAGQLATSTDSTTGKTTYYQYDALGDVTRTYHLWTNPTPGGANRWVVDTTFYDAAGRSTSTSEATYLASSGGALDVSATSLDGNGNGAVTDATYAAARITGRTYYDAQGRAFLTVDQYSRPTLNTYDVRGNVISTIDPDGTETRTAYDDMGRALWTSDRFASTSGFPFTLNADGTYTMGIPHYDATSTYAVTHTTTDSLGQSRGTERYQGASIAVTTDASAAGTGFLTSVAPDAAALQAAGDKVSATVTEYDDQGRADSSTAADGTQSTTRYTASGAAVQTRTVPKLPTNPTDVPTPTPDWTTTAQDYRELDVIRITGPVKAGDQFAVSLAGGGTPVVVTALSNGESITSLLADLAHQLNGTGTFRAIAADGYLVLADATDPAATGLSTAAPTLKPDSAASISDAVHVAAGVRNSWTIDALGRATVTDSDALGRAIRTTYDDGSYTQTLYGREGLSVSNYGPIGSTPTAITGTETVSVAQHKATTPAAQVTSTEDFSNAAGQLTDVFQPTVADALNAGSMTVPHWQYGYDTDGNEVTQTDAKSNTTHFAYDEKGQEVSRTLPDDNTPHPEKESFTYNADGTQATHTDFDGNVATYAYLPSTDPHAGMVHTITYAAPTGTPNKPTEVVTYTYDSLGRQPTVTDASGTTTNHYDTFGNLIGEETPEGTINYSFDPATGRHTETKTAFTDVFYTYDGLGRLSTVSASTLGGASTGSPLTATYGYDGAGNKTTEMLPNGVTTSYAYDDLNRLASLTETKGTSTLFSQSYILNDDGTRHSVHETELQADNTTTVTNDATWTYDAMNRLIGEALTSTDATRQYANTFAYDLNSNRTTSTHTGPGAGASESDTYAYNGDDQLTQQVGVSGGVTTTTAFHYDANGSQTGTTVNGAAGNSYAYDVSNKMTSATVNGVSSTYVYDDAENRVEETVGTAPATYYLTDTQNPTGYAQPIEARPSQTGVPTATYVLGDRVLAQFMTPPAATAPAVQYLLTDGHGSTRLLAKTDGTVAATFDYDVYGTPLTSSTNTALTPFLFGGDAVYDNATGFYMHGNGVRDREGYRFIQADIQNNGSSGEPISLHKYLYAAADSSNLWDPTGHGYAEILVGLGIGALLLGFLIVPGAMLVHVGLNPVPNGSASQTPGPGLFNTATHYHSAIISGGSQDLDHVFKLVTSLNDLPGSISASNSPQGVGTLTTFTLNGFVERVGEGSFGVRTVRYDPTARIMVVETLQGHPLSGWRAWRVSRTGGNNTLVETWSVDGPANDIEEFKYDNGGESDQKQVWKQFLLNVADEIGGNIVGGDINGTTPGNEQEYFQRMGVPQ